MKFQPRLFSDPQLNPATDTGWRRRWFDIIYRHDTPPSRNFDLALVLAILASVIVIMLDSVQAFHARHAGVLYALEWAFTLLFTAEYALRLATVRRPLRYAVSIWGIIDLLSILPTYISVLVPGAQSLLVVRILRILRIFRILKLVTYLGEARQLTRALVASRRKIGVFLFTVVTLVVIMGSLMFVIEGEENGFTSIPRSIYWAIVTMATVGFGDITPKTALGQIITAGIIIVGYGIIAVPTGIYSAELINSYRNQRRVEEHRQAEEEDATACSRCGLVGHTADARYCRRCGEALPVISRATSSPDSSDSADRAPA